MAKIEIRIENLKKNIGDLDRKLEKLNQQKETYLRQLSDLEARLANKQEQKFEEKTSSEE